MAAHGYIARMDFADDFYDAKVAVVSAGDRGRLALRMLQFEADDRRVPIDDLGAKDSCV